MLEGIGAVGPVGVHHGGGLGQGLLALVVVRHYHVQSDGGGKRHLVVAGDAAVHGDHQGGSLVPQALNGVFRQAVPILNPPGDIPQAPDAAAFQIVHQQHCGGDAVHVIVAEYGDGLSPGDGPLDTLHGFVHIPHEHGGEGQLPFPLQKFRRGLGAVHAPGGQHGGQQIGITRPPQEVHHLGIGGPDVPFFKFHWCRGSPFKPAAARRTYYNFFIITGKTGQVKKKYHRITVKL